MDDKNLFRGLSTWNSSSASDPFSKGEGEGRGGEDAFSMSSL